MYTDHIPVPRLTTAAEGSLQHVEKIILSKVALIESWFRQQWLLTPPPITSSVDLRNSGFKLAPIDTNLFPAGFNNLNPDFLPLCVQAIQAEMIEYNRQCRKILILPESHTRNRFYSQSLAVLRNVFMQAGFVVRIGSLDPELKEAFELSVEGDKPLLIEPLIRQENRVGLLDFDPCVLILNNDLSTGKPSILEGIEQPIRPTANLGWSSRLKSSHFSMYNDVTSEFSSLVDLDPWLINPYFKSVDAIDFMAQEGTARLASEVDALLELIKKQYASRHIKQRPFVAVKADNGTYGMSVMMVHDAEQILQLNRKQRTKMSSIKGSQKVDRVIIQEGIASYEAMANGAVAEPVVYMIGQFVVGGFYRVHQEKADNENLNAPGMHFEPLAFAKSCNMPREDLDPNECLNRFYVYGVIARLAALAAAREIIAAGD